MYTWVLVALFYTGAKEMTALHVPGFQSAATCDYARLTISRSLAGNVTVSRHSVFCFPQVER